MHAIAHKLMRRVIEAILFVSQREWQRMWPDPAWIRLLSQPRYQLAMGLAFLVLAALAHNGLLRFDDSWMTAAIWMGVLLLALACTGWALQCYRAIRVKRGAVAHLATLSKDEKVLLARALKENTRCITAFSLHPAVMSLKAKGIINSRLVIGEDAPHIIPDYVWKRLEKEKDKLLKYSDCSVSYGIAQRIFYPTGQWLPIMNAPR